MGGTMRIGGRQLGAMQSAAARCIRPGSASLAGLWVAVFGGNAGRRGPGVSEAVRGPSVKTSGDDGLAWGQSLAFAAWRCCGQRPGPTDLRREPVPA